MAACGAGRQAVRQLNSACQAQGSPMRRADGAQRRPLQLQQHLDIRLAADVAARKARVLQPRTQLHDLFKRLPAAAGDGELVLAEVGQQRCSCGRAYAPGAAQDHHALAGAALAAAHQPASETRWPHRRCASALCCTHGRGAAPPPPLPAASCCVWLTSVGGGEVAVQAKKALHAEELPQAARRQQHRGGMTRAMTSRCTRPDGSSAAARPARARCCRRCARLPRLLWVADSRLERDV